MCTHPALDPRPPMSAVVIALNEARRIEPCLKALKATGIEELIVVDGGSSDATVEIAKRYADQVIISDKGGVARDRQKGIDAASYDLVAMIDADHRVGGDTLDSLWRDMQDFGFGVVQAGVRMTGDGFWVQSENAAMEVFHHIPGPRTMIGTAPALYKKTLFDHIRFEDNDPEVSDDADFSYRLMRLKRFRFGIGRTVVAQEHFPDLQAYIKKFRWYGRDDAGFCTKHPGRAWSMVYHLFVRYPIVRPLRALLKGKPLAIPYFWMASVFRISGFVPALCERLLARAPLQKAEA